MNNRLYNYILNAVTDNKNADKVKNVIGTAKFNYLEKITDDEVKLKGAIEELLEDEFVKNGIEEGIDLFFDLDTDFVVKKTQDKITKTVLPILENLKEFDSRLSYLSKFNQKDFSKEKAVKLIQEAERNLTEDYDNFIFMVGAYFIAVQDFEKYEYYLSKSSSIDNKIRLVLVLANNSKSKKAISTLVHIYEIANEETKYPNYDKIFQILVEPTFIKSYRKEDIISSLNLLLQTKLINEVDLTNFIHGLILTQNVEGELYNIITQYLKIIENSEFKNSPGLLGLYSILGVKMNKDEKPNKEFELKVNQFLTTNEFELKDFNNYPLSLSRFVLNLLVDQESSDIDFKNFRSNQLSNNRAQQELSLVGLVLVSKFGHEGRLAINSKNISIKNYKLLKNHKVNIPSQINIFLGFNGSGKTSLLQAIALSLLPKLDKDINPNDYEQFITIGEEEIKIEVNWNNNLISRKLTIKDTGKAVDYPIFTHHEDEFLSRFILLGYGSNNFTRYTQHNYDDIVLKMLSGDDKFYHVNSLFEDYSDGFHDPLGVLDILERYEIQDIDGKKEEAKIIKKLFLDALNQLIVDYQIKQVRTSYKFFRGEEVLDLKHLSEGYRAVILLITDILIRVLSLRPTKLEEIQSKEKSFVLENVLEDTRGTILIDEFNRHLHPQWQRRFIDDLQRVLPNVQFVLTTHSPIAVLGREEDEVQVLEFNADGEIEIKKHEGGTKNLDVSLILLKYFGLESVVSPELQEKIDKYYELQINGETDETLEKELEAANLGIPIYDTRYLKFLEFLKKRNIDIRDMERIEDIEVNNEEWDELENELAELLD